MPDQQLLECAFFVPLRRDALLSDGALHSTQLWEWLDAELFNRFRGGTLHPGTYRGFYADPDSGERVDDESQKFTVALPEAEVDGLRELLAAACVLFQQKCIYLSVSGHVEFVAPAQSETDQS